MDIDESIEEHIIDSKKPSKPRLYTCGRCEKEFTFAQFCKHNCTGDC